MYRRNDPRFRRAINEISQTFESANASAQVNIFDFNKRYIQPCLSGVSSCFQPCVEHCFPSRDSRARLNRRSRGRAELNFDFYDDWDAEEDDGLMSWEDDEYDALLGDRGASALASQPARQRAMSYGTRKDTKARRKSGAADAVTEEMGVPGSSYFGLFGKLTGKIGGSKMLRYKPSAANLQEHPGESRKGGRAEFDPLMEEEEGHAPRESKHGRTRSGTASSRETSDSLSSRGDLFPSEDEDDATELDDEFAMVLERRTTGSGQDETSSGKTGPKKRPSAGSRTSTRTVSSRSTRRSKTSSEDDTTEPPAHLSSSVVDGGGNAVSSMTELKQEEEQVRQDEEAEVERKRDAAQKLASQRGLDGQDKVARQTDTDGSSSQTNETAKVDQDTTTEDKSVTATSDISPFRTFGDPDPGGRRDQSQVTPETEHPSGDQDGSKHV